MLRFPAKRIRAEYVAAWCRAALVHGVVCCSSGRAAAELEVACRRTGLRVVALVQPRRWYQAHELALEFPGLLDATPGHLPMHMLPMLGEAYRAHLEGNGIELHRARSPVVVPTGSGETLVALATAYPEVAQWRAVYSRTEPATRYEGRAPLNGLVAALAAVEHR